MLILWIDDDVANLEAQQEYLADEGFVVEVIDNLDDAWHRLTSEAAPFPDVIILDVMMATGKLLIDEETKGGLTSGANFLRKLHTSGLQQRTRVVVYTIVADLDAKDMVEQLGVPFVRKQSAPGKRIVELIKREIRSL